jgi:hypothetical protein
VRELQTKILETLRGGLVSIKGFAQLQCEMLGPNAKEFGAWKKTLDWADEALNTARELEARRRVRN